MRISTHRDGGSKTFTGIAQDINAEGPEDKNISNGNVLTNGLGSQDIGSPNPQMQMFQERYNVDKELHKLQMLRQRQLEEGRMSNIFLLLVSFNQKKKDEGKSTKNKKTADLIATYLPKLDARQIQVLG